MHKFLALTFLLPVASMAMHRQRPLVPLPKVTATRAMMPRPRVHYSTAKPDLTQEKLIYYKERISDARSEYLRHSTEYICAALAHELCESSKLQCSYNNNYYCACLDRMQESLKDAKRADEDLGSAREALYKFKFLNRQKKSINLKST